MLSAAGLGNMVMSSFIGTNTAGSAAIANGEGGVMIDRTAGSVVAGNTISGNGGFGGVNVGGTGAAGNLISGNRIGTNASGTAKIGNTSAGVTFATGSFQNTASFNTVSGNNGVGFMVLGNDDTIVENEIGLSSDGFAALGNTSHGVFLLGAVSDKVNQNRISANGGAGIQADGGSGVTLNGNRIGTNKAGTGSFGNVLGGVTLNSASGFGLGSNTIATNAMHGVLLSGRDEQHAGRQRRQRQRRRRRAAREPGERQHARGGQLHHGERRERRGGLRPDQPERDRQHDRLEQVRRGRP